MTDHGGADTNALHSTVLPLTAPRVGPFPGWPGFPCPPECGPRPAGSHRPDLVSTRMAPAQHLKEASTAPMAVTSVGS